MAENNGKKNSSINFVAIIIAVIVVIAIVFGIYMLVKNGRSSSVPGVDSIHISDSDSTADKIEKYQQKIDAINKEISKLQEKMDPELEKLNKLYEEYTEALREGQPADVDSEENVEAPAEGTEVDGTVQESTDDSASQE